MKRHRWVGRTNEEEALLKRRHQWGGGINEKAASMRRRYQWRGGIDEKEGSMRRMHWWGGGGINEEDTLMRRRHHWHQWRKALMRRRHQWRGGIDEEGASMKWWRDLDMNMKRIWGMLILIIILIRKPTWIRLIFANNVPATRVAGAVLKAAERGEKCLSSSSLCPMARFNYWTGYAYSDCNSN